MEMDHCYEQYRKRIIICNKVDDKKRCYSMMNKNWGECIDVFVNAPREAIQGSFINNIESGTNKNDA